MTESIELDLVASDGHQFKLLARIPEQPHASLLWLPALGVAARHYLPFADALAKHGIAVFLHEWRGNGSSNQRPSRSKDWGYQEILQCDLPASDAAITHRCPTLPRVLGGHSLGGQLASCYAGLTARVPHGLWLVASGTPWWRSFPAPHRYLLPLAYRFLPWLARRNGVLPGRRVGFGGNEARSLIRDWARVGISNRYAAHGMHNDLEQGMRNMQAPVTAIVLQNDWLAPKGSTLALLEKMPAAAHQLHYLSAVEIDTSADHFSWMKSPECIASVLNEKMIKNFSQKD